MSRTSPAFSGGNQQLRRSNRKIMGSRQGLHYSGNNFQYPERQSQGFVIFRGCATDASEVGVPIERWWQRFELSQSANWLATWIKTSIDWGE
jgi:hypothetical protein